jgi:hypothetical protein
MIADSRTQSRSRFVVSSWSQVHRRNFFRMLSHGSRDLWSGPSPNIEEAESKSGRRS